MTRLEKLARIYAPLVYLHPDDTARPSSIEFMLDNCQLKHDDDNAWFEDNLTIKKLVSQNVNGTSSWSNIRVGNSPYYLDPKNSTYKKGEPLVNKMCKSNCYFKTSVSGTDATIQYWFFYPYNPALNRLPYSKHVGDWEHVEVYLQDYLKDDKISMRWLYMDAHGSMDGKKYRPDEITYTPDGHPEVFSSLESHASYNTAGRQRRGFLGIIDDTTARGDTLWNTWECLEEVFEPGIIPLEKDWIGFTGRWGDDTGRPNSPAGPGMRRKFYGMSSSGIGLEDKGKVLDNTLGNWYKAGDRVNFIDLHGDGYNDIVLGPNIEGKWMSIENNELQFSSPNEVINIPAYKVWYQASDRIQYVDLTGNGLKDILLGPNNKGQWFVLENCEDGTFRDHGQVISLNMNDTSWNERPNAIYYADLNGNGLVDILIGPDENGAFFLIGNKGNFDFEGSLTDPIYQHPELAKWHTRNERIKLIVTTDHKTTDHPVYLDLIIGPTEQGEWYLLKNNGSFDFEYQVDPIIQNSKFGRWYKTKGIINHVPVCGNDLEDILIGPDENGSWWLVENNGDGTFYVHWNALLSSPYSNWYKRFERINFFDITRNGFSDIVMGPDNNGKWYVIENHGDKILQDRGSLLDTAYGNWYQEINRIKYVDLNKDGGLDIILGPDINGDWFLITSL